MNSKPDPLGRINLKQLAKENPTYTFTIIYDRWESPGSTKHRQIRICDVPAIEMANKYGNFLFDHWYTTSRMPDAADIWVTATEPEFLYDNPNGKETNMKTVFEPQPRETKFDGKEWITNGGDTIWQTELAGNEYIHEKDDNFDYDNGMEM